MILLRIFALAIVVLLLVPVALLPIGTAVPKSILVVFAVVEIALLAVLFRSVRARRILLTLAGFVAIAILAIFGSQIFASTPPILDANDKPIPNSIAVLEQVKLNGTKQWITIRGKDVTRPVLLFLAGGPGGSELVWTRKYLDRLEDRFVVVNWDQPGAAKSYNAIPIPMLTTERYIADAHQLVELLRSRFQQDKLYLLGESWGTILGIELVQQYPNLFHAYIGSGQMVNTTENDVMGYQFALKWTRDRGDTKTLETLQRNGSPPYIGNGMFMKYIAYFSVLNSYMFNHAPGEGTEGNRLLDVLGIEYGYVDKVNWFRGLIDVFTIFYPKLADLDFSTQAAKLEVPVYFTVGRWDVNAMASLVERYYKGLQAPHKELIWFEKSGHTPLYEEPKQFVDIIVNRVLAKTLPVRSN
ncbi:MAG: alpha/beta fold hydrolase [Richelia sp. CSU_2_1]|nr:alpha/beta fold hydrolase [Microcoleus sp. SU_5_6]NJR25202.1 alpha/beta fold hydrolase [Richelia sp. CSU_2_1]